MIILNILAQAEEAGGGLSTSAAARLAAGIAMGFGAIGPGIGIGIGLYSAAQAIARNPDAEGSIRQIAILGLGFAEAIGIYALVVALVLIFVG